jgi:hypothetical protein
VDSVTAPRGDGSNYDIGADEFGGVGPVEGEVEGAEGEGEAAGEGEGEGEGEGSASCGLETVAVTQPRAGARVVVPVGASSLRLTVTSVTNCEPDTAGIAYELDGTAFGTAERPPYAATFNNLAQLSAGPHTVTAIAAGAGNGLPLTSANAIFTLVRALAGSDANNDGFPDDPALQLTEHGDTWNASATEPTTGATRTVLVVRLDGATAQGEETIAAVTDPINPARRVHVRVPAGLILPDETALLVMLYAPDKTTLLGPAQAALMGTEPSGGLAAGGQFVEVSLLVSAAGGPFVEISNARLAATPLKIAMEGILSGAGVTRLFAHATDASLGLNGLVLTVPPGSAWGTGGVSGLRIVNGRLDAELSALSTFAPFRITQDDSQIRVTPSQVVFGRVEVNTTKDAVFIVTNVGGGVMNGAAAVSAPFSIVGNAAYSLSPGASKEVTVRFAPVATVDYQAVVSFSGGGGATRNVFGTGIPQKRVRILGCAVGADTPGRTAGDFLVVFTVLLALFVCARRRGRETCKG